MFRTIALTGFAALVAATTISLAPPARAQIGNIFSDPPLRPPGAIPNGPQAQQPRWPITQQAMQPPPRYAPANSIGAPMSITLALP